MSTDEGRHAVRVLGLRIGDSVEVFDGVGNVAVAGIHAISRDIVMLAVQRPIQVLPPSLPRLTLCVAPPKGDRQQFLVEKCTELGVSALCPLLTARGVVRPTDALVDRWHRWAREACKQCGRAWIPDILPCEDLKASVREMEQNALLLFAHRGTIAQPWGRYKADCSIGRSICVFIGPEGGWAPEEVAWASGAGLRPLLLSDATLRTETAAVAATAVIRAFPPVS